VILIAASLEVLNGLSVTCDHCGVSHFMVAEVAGSARFPFKEEVHMPDSLVSSLFPCSNLSDVWFLLRRACSPFLFLLLLACRLTAQTDPNAGIQMWSTNEFGVDVSSMAINLQIPARSKAGPIPYSSNFVGTTNAYEYSIIVDGQPSKGIQVNNDIAYGLPYVDPRGLGITATETNLNDGCGVGGAGGFHGEELGSN
jgi:hypothetical protein